MASNEKKSRVKYESEIITRPITYEKAQDVSQIPVFKIENCEILNSSIGNLAPTFGHNVQIMLPSDCSNLIQADRVIRNNYLLQIQQDVENGNPNLEIVKGSITAFTQADVLKGKTDEAKIGRYHINFAISNSCLFERSIGEDGKPVDKKIGKESEAKAESEVIMKYFRCVDGFTGEGIDPEIFKYVNGEKVKTFVNPKTKEEKPLYIGRGDIVNIVIRPFGVKNQKTNEYTLRYNILSIEIVQTAWDRGIGRKAGSSNNVKEVAESLGGISLGNIFGNVSSINASTTNANTVTQANVTQSIETAPVQKEVAQTTPPVQETVPTTTQPQAQQESSPTVALDFSALANMSMAGLNLGE